MTKRQRWTIAAAAAALSAVVTGAIEFGDRPTDFQLYMWVLSSILSPVAVIAAALAADSTPKKTTATVG